VKRYVLAAALALAAMLTFSEVASAARWAYYGAPHPVAVGGPYRVIHNPITYSTTLVPGSPTLVVGPRGRVHYVRPAVTTAPYTW
jgi:hypothetical protein